MKIQVAKIPLVQVPSASRMLFAAQSRGIKHAFLLHAVFVAACLVVVMRAIVPAFCHTILRIAMIHFVARQYAHRIHHVAR